MKKASVTAVLARHYKVELLEPPRTVPHVLARYGGRFSRRRTPCTSLSRGWRLGCRIAPPRCVPRRRSRRRPSQRERQHGADRDRELVGLRGKREHCDTGDRGWREGRGKERGRERVMRVKQRCAKQQIHIIFLCWQQAAPPPPSAGTWARHALARAEGTQRAPTSTPATTTTTTTDN